MASDYGYGQVQLPDGTSDLNSITAICRALIAQLDTMKLVKVVAVHAGSGEPPAGGTVDVTLLVSQIDGNGFPVQHGTVYGIPFYRLQAGAWAVVADPAVGDVGYVVCADRDSSVVVANGTSGAQQNPGSRRRYNVADGVYVGAVGILNAAPTSYLWLKADGSFKLADKFGNKIELTSSGITVTDLSGNVIQGAASGITIKVGGTTVLTLTASLADFAVNVQAPDFVTPTLPSYVSHTHAVAAAPGESAAPTGGT